MLVYSFTGHKFQTSGTNKPTDTPDKHTD